VRPELRGWPVWLPLVACVPAGVAARLSETFDDVRVLGILPVACAALALAWGAAALVGRRVPRRRALAALVSGTTVLAIAGLAIAGGALEARAEVERGGFVGGADTGTATIVATQIDPDSQLGRLLAGGARAWPIAFAVDNRGEAPLELDLSAATVERDDGSSEPLQRGGRLRVPALARSTNGLAFAGRSLERAVAITVRAGGRPLALRGRFLGADEKRAMRPRR
jgi:hypothetical protein